MENAVDAKYVYTISYGKEIRKKEFRMREGAVHLNHGAYGMVPLRVKEAQKRLLDELDYHPDDWFQRKAWNKWIDARNTVADFVNADHDDVVFVKNTTTGINSILKSYPFKPEDAILTTDNNFPPVQFACDDVSIKQTGKAYIMEIEFPIQSESTLVEQYRTFLNEHSDVKVVILDHITSPSAMKLPVEKIVPICKEHGALTIVDGANVPGHLQLDFKKLQPDFYLGNFHKWLFTPRSSAMMYVDKKHQDWVRPLVTSANYKKSMVKEFFKQGCHDDIPYICVPEALQFIKDIGGMEQIIEYNSKLLDRACALMISAWSTSRPLYPKSMEAPCVRMVPLPPLRDYAETVEDAERLHQDVYKDYDVQIQTISVHGPLYVRIAAQVYNELADYQKLIDIINELRQK